MNESKMKSGILFRLFLILLIIMPLYAEALTTNKTLIKVGVYNNQPKIFYNEKGEPDGIFIDVIEAIAKKEDLQIEYVSGEWTELFALLQNGDIDVLPDMAYSHERDSLFSLSKLSLLGSWLEVFTTSRSQINSIDDLQNKRIGVLKGSIQEEFVNNMLIKNSNRFYTIFSFNDYSGSLHALKNQEIDVIVANRFFYFSDLFDEEIIPSGVILQLTDLHFAFRKNINHELVNIFDKNISMLKNNPKSVYYASLQYWFNKNKRAGIPTYIYWLIAIIVFCLLIASSFAFLLQYKVKQKTIKLQLKNEELILAKEKAEESDKLKTVFLQNLSHEIRTPMNGILGFINLLKDKDFDALVKSKYIDVLNQSGQRLLATLSNIIEISRIESNEIIFNPTKVIVSEIMKYYYNFFQQEAHNKGLIFKLSNQIQDRNFIIKTDKSILDSILTNLLQNAIKFTKEGVVEFGCYAENESVIFYIKDSGIGIPEDRREAIFDRFVQADLNLTRSYEGSGLGLSIVKAHVVKLHGRIWVESQLEVGSTFFFSIPISF